ncbi:hypothetical protein [Sinorhizobium medicae]|uniref:hypothetical protein n=1 Tax=Sinorhizobium medicae TaxID=110321 RepID=UPI001F3E0D33|nr:hypothetical protein [Sinorhizobium medicae]
MWGEEHRADDAVEAVGFLNKQRQTQAADIEKRHQHERVKGGHLGGLPEQRVTHHFRVVGHSNETVGSETVDVVEPEHQRQEHRQAEKNQQAERVGQHEKVAGDPFAISGRQAAVPEFCFGTD